MVMRALHAIYIYSIIVGWAPGFICVCIYMYVFSSYIYSIIVGWDPGFICVFMCVCACGCVYVCMYFQV
jgi:hypothetical protein